MVLFPLPSRTRLQGDGIYGLTVGARPSITESAPGSLLSVTLMLWSWEASSAPHLGYQYSGGNTRLVGLLPSLMAVRVPALPSTRSGPQHQPCLSRRSSGVSAGSCLHGDAHELSRLSVHCLPDYSVQPGHTLAGWERWDKARTV